MGVCVFIIYCEYGRGQKTIKGDVAVKRKDVICL